MKVRRCILCAVAKCQGAVYVCWQSGSIVRVQACMCGYLLRCASAQIVEDDITAQEAKAARRTATSDKVAEGRAPGAQGAEGGKPINPTAVKILLPALKELMQGMGTQYDLLKEVVAAVQVCPLQVLALFPHHLCSSCRLCKHKGTNTISFCVCGTDMLTGANVHGRGTYCPWRSRE